MEILDRIRLIIENERLTIASFERKIGVSNATIGKAIERNKGVSSDVLQKILETFLMINPDWLLLGKGEMLRQNVSKSEVLSADHEAVYKNFIADKEKKIEELTRENEQLRIENEQLKSSSGNTGIVVQHDGGGNHYSINNDLQQLAASQQKAILNLTEQNATLTKIIANKL